MPAKRMPTISRFAATVFVAHQTINLRMFSSVQLTSMLH
jgi:hypothetical protein